MDSMDESASPNSLCLSLRAHLAVSIPNPTRPLDYPPGDGKQTDLKKQKKIVVLQGIIPHMSSVSGVKAVGVRARQLSMNRDAM